VRSFVDNKTNNAAVTKQVPLSADVDDIVVVLSLTNAPRVASGSSRRRRNLVLSETPHANLLVDSALV